jgi:menaquinone-dependent protoporphyrinogen oxidase
MTNTKISRRSFLKAAGITLAATTLTCTGLGFAATRVPAIETADLTFSEDSKMKKRILVTYATRAGSTAEVAAAIGKTLNQRGFSVDVKSVKEQPELGDYQAVVCGSAIRMGNWLPEAVAYVKDNLETFKVLPFAAFSVHLQNTAEDELSLSNRKAYLNSVRTWVNPAEEGYFAGNMDLSKLSFADRLVTKMVKSPLGDQRDWEKINSWSNTLFSAELG